MNLPQQPPMRTKLCVAFSEFHIESDMPIAIPAGLPVRKVDADTYEVVEFPKDSEWYWYWEEHTIYLESNQVEAGEPTFKPEAESPANENDKACLKGCGILVLICIAAATITPVSPHLAGVIFITSLVTAWMVRADDK